MDGSAIEKLITDISKLPGLGRRSSQRIALYLLKNKDRSLLPLIQIHQTNYEDSTNGNKKPEWSTY